MEEPPEDPLVQKEGDIVDFVVKQGYGIINIGLHRAIWVAPEEYVVDCPPRWIFIPSDAPDLEALIREAMTHKIKSDLDVEEPPKQGQKP